MMTNVVRFPAPRRAKSATGLLSGARGTIVSLDRWKQRPRPMRTANGVFFTTQVLTTPGDLA